MVTILGEKTDNKNDTTGKDARHARRERFDQQKINQGSHRDQIEPTTDEHWPEFG